MIQESLIFLKHVLEAIETAAKRNIYKSVLH